MLLADAGASVLRVDRPSPSSSASSPLSPTGGDLLTRRKTSIAVDLKDPAGAALIRSLVRHARVDVLIDPFRPGVLERLRLGPADLLALNPRLVYARLTGFRRDGRWAAMAGHDINYLSVSGVLSLLGRAGADAPPTPPANMLADFAGGGAMLVHGILLALLSRATTGRGQVVEAAMVDGASYVATFGRFLRATPAGNRPRGENLLDSGCPFYDAYACAAGTGWMAVGALEPRFFAALLGGLGLRGRGWEERQYDRASWPALRRALAAAFAARTRDQWEAVFAGTDACCTPVYDYAELARDVEGKEGDQRPPVTLRDTPCLAVRRGAADVRHGQGPGVEGEGYVGYPLAPGQGGEATLKEWLNWTKGNQFEVEGGGLVLKEKARL